MLSKQDAAKLQRNNEKRAFYKRFRFRIIEDHFKMKLYHLFECSCFNCGESEEMALSVRKPSVLTLDHHVPQISDGHYELGNLVVLCRQCNGIKHKCSAEQFYAPEKLAELEKILARQRMLDFSFEFDHDFWLRDRAGYLTSLGISKENIHTCLHDELHPYYIEPYNPDNNIGVIIAARLT